MAQTKPGDNVVVLEYLQQLGSLPESARGQIRNLDFLSVHERAAAYGQLYSEIHQPGFEIPRGPRSPASRS